MAAEDLKLVEIMERTLGLFDLTTPEGRPHLETARDDLLKELGEVHAKLDPKWAREQAKAEESGEAGATGATGATGARGASETAPTSRSSGRST